MIGTLLRAFLRSYAGLPRAVWVLAFVHFVNRSGTMVLTFLAIWLTEVVHFDERTAGTVLATWGLGAIVGGLGAGWLCDRIPANRIQVASLFLSGGCLVILGRLESIETLSVMLFVTAAFSEALRPANATLLTEHTPIALRTRAFALNRLAVNAGMAIGPAVGGWLALSNYDLLFIVDGATCVIAGALLLLLFRPAPPEPTEASPAATRAESGGPPWRDRPFLSLLALNTLLMTAVFQMFHVFAVYLKRIEGLNEFEIGLLFDVNTGIIILVEMVLIAAIGRFDELRVIGVGAVFACASFALLPLGTGWAWVALAMVVFTIGEMLTMPVLSGFVSKQASRRYRGSYMGLYNASFSISFALAPFIGFRIVTQAGFDTLWYLCGAVGLVALVGFEFLARRHPR